MNDIDCEQREVLVAIKEVIRDFCPRAMPGDARMNFETMDGKMDVHVKWRNGKLINMVLWVDNKQGYIRVNKDGTMLLKAFGFEQVFETLEAMKAFLEML